MVAVQERLTVILYPGTYVLIFSAGHDRFVMAFVSRKINHSVDRVAHDNGWLRRVQHDDAFRFFRTTDVANAPGRGACKLINIMSGAWTCATTCDCGYCFGILDRTDPIYGSHDWHCRLCPTRNQIDVGFCKTFVDIHHRDNTRPHCGWSQIKGDNARCLKARCMRDVSSRRSRFKHQLDFPVAENARSHPRRSHSQVCARLPRRALPATIISSSTALRRTLYMRSVPMFPIPGLRQKFAHGRSPQDVLRDPAAAELSLQTSPTFSERISPAPYTASQECRPRIQASLLAIPVPTGICHPLR